VTVKMSDTDQDVACAVCEQRLGKTRCHYGGVSCYSCRAFFRRNTQRPELPVCKAEEGCVVNTTVRKQCAACRYQKCLRIGMKPELVLNEDEKKTRFRKFLSKRASDPMEEGPTRSKKQPKQKRGRGGPSDDDHVEYASMMTSQVSEDGSSTEFPVEVKTEVLEYSSPLEFATDHMYYSETTGDEDRSQTDRRAQEEILWLRLGSQEPVVPNSEQHFIKQEDEEDHTSGRSIIPGNTSKLGVLAQIAPDELRQYLTNVNTTSGQMGQMSGSTPSPSTSTIIYHSSTPVIRHKPEIPVMADPVSTETSGVAVVETPGVPTQAMSSAPGMESSGNNWSQEPPSQERSSSCVRRSVIVRAGAKDTSKDNLDEYSEMHDVLETAISLLPDTSEVVDNLSGADDEASFKSISKSISLVTHVWGDLSFGTQALQEYINFCYNRGHFPDKFYNNRVFRERFHRILYSLEDLSSVSSEEKQMMLKYNVVNAEMFCYIHAFNKSTWEEELDFLLGTEDKIFMMSCNPSLRGVPLSTMITSSPLSELNKLELYRYFSMCSPPDGLLADQGTFCLTLLLILLTPFHSSTSPIYKAQVKYETLLMSYLKFKRGKDIQGDLNTIFACIKKLPVLAELFVKMKSN